MTQSSKISQLLVLALLFFLVSIVAQTLLSAKLPVISTARYTLAEEGTKEFTNPLVFTREHVVVKLSLQIDLSSSSSDEIVLEADDRILKLWVNGEEVSKRLEKTPHSPFSYKIKTSPPFGPANNFLTATIKNHAGPGSFQVSIPQANKELLCLSLLFVFSLSMLIFICTHKFITPYKSKVFSLVCISGIALRISYTLSTPSPLRAYDFSGHEQYILYILENFSIPKASLFWESYQAPLYYFISALIVKTGTLFGLAQNLLIANLQILSLAFSIGSFLIACSASKLCFSKGEAEGRNIFLALTAVFPGLVLFASRISNDVLQLFLQMACIYALLYWLRSRKTSHFFLASVFLALAILTKIGSLFLIPVAVISVLLLAKTSNKQMFLLLLLLATVLLTLVGPYAYLRIIGESQSSLIGSGTQLNQGLKLESFKALSFNPLAVLQNPFNDTWNEEQRRSYFWEFFYRSIFFGEFKFTDSLKPIAVLLLFNGMLLLPFLILGIWHDIRTKSELNPLFLPLLIIGLCSLLAFRYFYPYSPTQDFRHVAILFFPISYYLARGSQRLQARLRAIASFLVFQLSCLLVFFFAVLFLTSIKPL